jgi:hypothetical protein
MVGDRTLQDAHRYGGVEIPTSGFTHFAEGIGEPKTPSHGENRGSSPLGSAKKINDLISKSLRVSRLCPVESCRNRSSVSGGVARQSYRPVKFERAMAFAPDVAG